MEDYDGVLPNIGIKEQGYREEDCKGADCTCFLIFLYCDVAATG